MMPKIWFGPQFLHRFKIRIFILIISSVGFLQNSVHARIGLDISVWAVFDENAFRNYEYISDEVFQPQATLYYMLSNENAGLKMFYQGMFSHFRTYSNRKFQYHKLGANGWWQWGDSPVKSYWGVDAAKRRNSYSYAYHDYEQYSSYFNIRIDEDKTGNWRTGVFLTYRSYRNLLEFSYIVFNGFIGKTIFLQTKTSVIGRLYLGYKRFIESRVSDIIVQDIVEGYQDDGRGQGNGQGNNKGKGSNSGNNHGENEREASANVITEKTIQVTIPGDQILQWVGVLRIGQSLGPKTGITIQGRIQRDAKGQGRYISYQDYGYEEEDYLFDDPYNYDSNEILLEFTQIFPWLIKLKIGAEYLDKAYQYPPYDFEGNLKEDIFRQDQRTTFWIWIQKRISIPLIIQNLSIALSFQSIHNHSNDIYFHYDNRILNLGWEIKF